MQVTTPHPAPADSDRSTHVLRGFGLAAVSGLLLLTACSDQSTTAPALDPAPERPAFQLRGSSADIPPMPFARPDYVRAPGAGAAGQLQAQVNGDVIRVYQDEQPWFGADRAHSTLVDGLGKTLGVDYFIHPLSDLLGGIPAQTRAVVLTSNSEGSDAQAMTQNDPAAQAALEAFLATGGSLVVDMGDNLWEGGFIAPGSLGTPDPAFPWPCHEARLTPEAAGHPMVIGPDGLPGTADDLTNENVSLDDNSACYVAHGNLEEGITLPADHTPLMTATFDDVARVIMAEYCHDGGRVILDTNTKEWIGQHPEGFGPAHVMTNLFHYALSEASACDPSAAVDIDIRPGGGPNNVNPKARGVLPVAILSTPSFDAATEVDRESITFGRTGDEISLHRRGRTGTPDCNTADVNGDRRADLVCRFEIQKAGFRTGDTEGILKARTVAGTSLEGRDAVRIVPRG